MLSELPRLLCSHLPDKKIIQDWSIRHVPDKQSLLTTAPARISESFSKSVRQQHLPALVLQRECTRAAVSANALAAKGAPRERPRPAANPILKRQMPRRPAAQWTATLLAALLTVQLQMASANVVGVHALDGQLQLPSRRPLGRRALLQVEPAVTDAASQGSSLTLPPQVHIF